jgi:hypothetical protein
VTIRILARGSLLAALAIAIACSPQQATPEARVRAVLADLEVAAEARDVASMKERVSDDYRDARGQDRQAAAALLTMHFLQNRAVYLLTRVDEVVAPEGGTARASVLVAMAGAPIPSPAALPGLRADLYHFAFELREEGGAYRITSASWRPASLDDFR